MATLKRTSFYALAVPEGSPLPPSVNGLIYHDLKDALAAAKQIKGSRFKEFDEEEDALNYSQQNVSILDTSAVMKNEAEKSSVAAFKSLPPRELAPFRRLIEAGKEEDVKNLIWSNPRYLISSGDTAVVLMEGPRYNASHCAAKADRAEVLEVILNTVRDPKFIKTFYLSDDEETTKERARVLLDCYLNTPDKGACETPLHFAAKFGAYSAAKVLLSFKECDTQKKNKFGMKADQVICERKHQTNKELKDKIKLLFESRLFIPVIRTDDSVTVGRPTDSCEGDDIEALAGPMSPPQAQEMFKLLKSPDRRNPQVEARLSDSKKGIERMARLTCRDMGVDWKEWWPFLQTKVDLSSIKGLKLLEQHLKIQADNQHKLHVDNLCARLLDIGLNRDRNDSDSDEDVFVTAPSSPVKPRIFVEGPSFSEWDRNAFLALEGVEIDSNLFPYVSSWFKNVKKEMNQLPHNGLLTPKKWKTNSTENNTRLFFSP